MPPELPRLTESGTLQNGGKEVGFVSVILGVIAESVARFFEAGQCFFVKSG